MSQPNAKESGNRIRFFRTGCHIPWMSPAGAADLLCFSHLAKQDVDELPLLLALANDFGRAGATLHVPEAQEALEDTDAEELILQLQGLWQLYLGQKNLVSTL